MKEREAIEKEPRVSPEPPEPLPSAASRRTKRQRPGEKKARKLSKNGLEDPCNCNEKSFSNELLLLAETQVMVSELCTRANALKERVATLERFLTQSAGTQTTETLDQSEKAELPRCPGCRLPIESTAGSTCVLCGFVFDAVV